MTQPAQQSQTSGEAFVLAHLPQPPGRVLEIGCGEEGGYAVSMAGAGHDVVAVDPVAPDGPTFRQCTFEEFDEPGPFDRIVCSLAFHHVEDLGLVLDKAVRLLGDAGRLIVIEWAWERFDEATAAWCLQRLPPGDAPNGGWLGRRPDEWRRSPEPGLSFAGYLRGWAENRGLHDSRAVLTELEARFRTELLEWGPYLYPELDETNEEDERAAIRAGNINATCFRFVGRVA